MFISLQKTVKPSLFVVGFNIFRLKSLEGFDWNIGDQCVQFVGRVLIVISSASQANANTEWGAPAIRCRGGREREIVLF